MNPVCINGGNSSSVDEKKSFLKRFESKLRTGNPIGHDDPLMPPKRQT